MTANQKFRKWNTGIGFRNRERLFPVLPIVKKKLIPTDRPTVDFFEMWPSKHTFWGPYYMLGRRRNCNIIHTRLWHQCSSLGADLFKANIIIDPSCPCRCPLEDAMHYLLQCPLYRNAIMQLFINITPHYFENWEPGWHNELGSWIT
jgi:hypothetical protein